MADSGSRAGERRASNASAAQAGPESQELKWSLPPIHTPAPAPESPHPAAIVIDGTRTAPPPAARAPTHPFGQAEPGRDTLRALSRLRHATVIAMISAAATTAVGAFALYLYVDPSLGPSVYAVPPALGLELLSFLLQVIAAGLGWSAFEEIAESAREISMEHERAAKRALQFAYYAGAAWFVGGITALAVSGAYALKALTGAGAGQAGTVAYLSLITTFALTGLAMNTLIAIAMQSAIGKLMRERGRERRKPFLALALGGTLASVTVSLYCVAVLQGPDVYPLVAVVSAASLAVYLVQIREAEEGARILALTRGTDPDAPAPVADLPGRTPV